MKKRLIIELCIFTIVWIVFIFIFLFPEAKQYLKNQNPSLRTPDVKRVKQLKQEISTLILQKDLLNKKLFPLNELVPSRTSLSKIFDDINNNAREQKIITANLKFKDGQKVTIEEQTVNNMYVYITVKSGYAEIMAYLNLLETAPIYLDCDTFNLRKIAADGRELQLDLIIRTLCYE